MLLLTLDQYSRGCQPFSMRNTHVPTDPQINLIMARLPLQHTAACTSLLRRCHAVPDMLQPYVVQACTTLHGPQISSGPQH